MTDKPKPKHGGARANAGAKPKRGARKIPTSIGVSPEVKAYLDQADPSGSEAVEDAVRGSKKFKEWKRNAKSSSCGDDVEDLMESTAALDQSVGTTGRPQSSS